MNLLALAGSSYENTARGILYVVYEILWKIIYYVLLLVDEITNLFYKVAGINVSNGIVENRNIFEQLLNQNIISAWYGFFILIASALVVIFTLISVIRVMGTNNENKRSYAPIFRNVGLALLLLIVLGPIVLLLISLLSNVAVWISMLGGNNDISIADILFANSGNLITVYNETYGTEVASFRELGNDFLYELFYNPSTAENATQLTFHWYIALLGGIFVLYNLAIIVIEIVKRIFNIVLLYVASPFAISKLALDDGKSFKAWQSRFFYEFVLLFTQIGTFMIFAALVNVLRNIDFTGLTNTTTATSEPSILEPTEVTPVVTEETAYSLLNGLGRTLVIMAAVSVTRSSSKMLSELLTSKESETESLLSSLLNRISTRSATPVLRTRTITKNTTTTKRETVFVDNNAPSDNSSTRGASDNLPRSNNNLNRSINTTSNTHLNQTVNVNNRFSNVNNIANRTPSDNVRRGSYEGNRPSPANIYINTTRVEQPTTGATSYKFMDEATRKAATSVVRDYNRANTNLNSAISSGNTTSLKQSFSEYSKAYAKEAELLSSNYRKFETRAGASMKSEISNQTKQELKNITESYRKAQLNYAKTASKLQQYDGERMSTAEALKVKEKADKQRERLMNASNRAAQFYDNQKKEEE